MEKKYQIRYDLNNQVYDRTLYRIQALKNFGRVKKGELGGWIQKEDNLSQEGNCWIFDEACVFDNAQIKDDAHVYDNAMVYSVGTAHDNAKIYGDSQVFGCAYVRGNANVLGNAKVHGNCIVCGNVIVYGNANIDCYTFTDEDTHNAKDVCSCFKEYFNENMQEKDEGIHTWWDLVDSRVKREYYDATYGLAIKSLIAKFKIEKLMPYFGGVITDEEWHNQDLKKFAIVKISDNGKPCLTYATTFKTFLAFHTEKDAYNFMSYSENVQLVKDYFMMD